ncbi:hypothetical protein Bbelb_079360 [Branchiostoma belcheri]|nr:hypothetical protein Bbelb_079360 [Branchiostoma belcheri]
MAGVGGRTNVTKGRAPCDPSGQAKRDLSDAERRYALHREPSSSDCGHNKTSVCVELWFKVLDVLGRPNVSCPSPNEGTRFTGSRPLRDVGTSNTSACEELQTKEIWRPLAAHVDLAWNSFSWVSDRVTLNCSFHLLGTLSSGLKRRFCERMIGRPGDLLAVRRGVKPRVQEIHSCCANQPAAEGIPFWRPRLLAF